MKWRFAAGGVEVLKGKGEGSGSGKDCHLSFCTYAAWAWACKEYKVHGPWQYLASLGLFSLLTGSFAGHNPCFTYVATQRELQILKLDQILRAVP